MYIEISEPVMKLSEDIHPLLDKRCVTLLSQFNIRTLSQLVAAKPEKLSSILGRSYTVVCKLRKDLLAEFASFPVLGLEDYQSKLEREASISTGNSNLDKMLGGGLRGGTVYEVYGYPGTGKTQLCLTAACNSLIRNGTVIVIDTKGDFCADRFIEILSSRSSCGANSSLNDRLKICSARTAGSLLESVQVIDQMEGQDVSLLVVDNISLPVMRLVIDGDIQTGMNIGSRISQLLHKIADCKGSAVLLVSNMKGGTGNCSSGFSCVPALGSVWNCTAGVRILLTRESITNISGTITRGSNIGAKCFVTVNKSGIVDIV